MSGNHIQLGSIGAAFIQCEGKAYTLHHPPLIYSWA